MFSSVFVIIGVRRKSKVKKENIFISITKRKLNSNDVFFFFLINLKKNNIKWLRKTEF